MSSNIKLIKNKYFDTVVRAFVVDAFILFVHDYRYVLENVHIYQLITIH